MAGKVRFSNYSGLEFDLEVLKRKLASDTNCNALIHCLELCCLEIQRIRSNQKLIVEVMTEYGFDCYVATP